MESKNHINQINFEESFDFFKLEIEKEIQSFNSMTQEEYMHERKIEEMNQHYKIGDLPLLSKLRNRFWKFNNLEDYQGCIEQIKNIKPCLIPGNNNWVDCRRLISSANYSRGLGRSIKYFVIDETTDKLLGLIEVKSDFKTLTSREELIGWDNDMKIKCKKLNNTAILSTLIAVPDFGVNGLGAKLIVFLSLSDVIRNTWWYKYNDVLEGTTTTSLYGHNKNGSIYTGNKYFKSLKHTNGDVIYELPDDLYKNLKNIISTEFPEDYEKINNGTNPKQRLMDFIFKVYQIKRSIGAHGFERGTYFCSFYLETSDHLNNKNLEKYTPRFKYTVQDIFDEWLPKSLKRFDKLYKEKRLTSEFKSYEKLIYNI